MGANEKLRARYRAVELQRKKNEERARRERSNAAGAEEIRAILHRLGAVDSWERKRFDHAAESIRADAVRRRSGHFRGLQTVIEQMRARGQTLAQISLNSPVWMSARSRLRCDGHAPAIRANRVHRLRQKGAGVPTSAWSASIRGQTMR